jgi:hypothetical protein
MEEFQLSRVQAYPVGTTKSYWKKEDFGALLGTQRMNGRDGH